jgi:chlorobactene glucosyltransferase
MRNRLFWRQSLTRLALWAHVAGIVGFYAIIWRRTYPDAKDQVRKLPLKKFMPTPAHPGEPTVSIIVPARNEEQNIGRCITSLLEQDYEQFEVIAVDDGSTDNTSNILDELAHSHPQGHRLWVLRLRDDLPAGWAGKPHAIHRGVQEAQGEWLLFTDADTWHAPNALRSSITQAVEEGDDLFTVGAEQELHTFWERVLMPMAYLGISMLYPPRLVNDPKSHVAVANGQYILIRKEVYTIIGGYGRPDLRDTLLDDRDLARVVKETGFKLHFVDGQDLVHVHMYNGFSDTWRGWRKNAYLGNRGGILFILTQLIGLPMVGISPFLLPLLALFTKRQKGDKKRLLKTSEVGTAATLELTTLLLYRSWLNRSLRVPWYYSFTHPLAAAVFTGILAQSSWRVLTHKGVDWRGRVYHDKVENTKVPV